MHLTLNFFYFYNDVILALFRSVPGGSTGIDTWFMKKKEMGRKGLKKTKQNKTFSSMDVYNNQFSLFSLKKEKKKKELKAFAARIHSLLDFFWELSVLHSH